MSQGITKSRLHTHTLHAHHMGDEFYGRFGTLCNPTQGSRSGDGDGHHYHGSGINSFQKNNE